DVDLGHLGAGPLAAVDHGEINRHGGKVVLAECHFARRDLEIFIREAGVRESVPERKERSDALGIVVAISDKDSLRIMGEAAAAGNSLILLVVVVVLKLHDRSGAGILFRFACRNILEALGKCDGEPSGGVEVSKKDGSNSVTVFLAWIPGLEDCRHL